MKLTATPLRPIVTLLSGSRGASRIARDLCLDERFFNMEEIKLSATNDDALENAYKPFLRKGFDSVGCIDKESGTIIHFLALNNSHVETDLCLLAITDSENDNDAVKCVQEARDEIAQHIDKSWKNAAKLLALQLIGKNISPQHLTSLDNGLPLLVLPANDKNEVTNSAETKPASSSSVKLREIAIPFNFDSTYADGSSLMQKLSQSNLSRPKTGLYQWPAPSPLVLRPLPSANSDFTLPFPSFIFQCDSLQDKNERLKKDIILSKVGCNSNKPGQLMIHHRDVQGVELRYCEERVLSSSFAEAQESLMAGSLDDLQNANVMVEGGKTRSLNDVQMTTTSSRARVDVMNGLGDCWVEFRANMKRPQGFFDKKARAKTVKRTAKAPDLPYE